MAIPVYAFTGFLDAGKTKFIQETLEDERFNAGERTLLLICEEGEEEYDLSVYPYQHVYPEVIDQEAVTTEELSQLFKKHHCERVVVELNGMLQVGPFYQKMPEDWQIAQEVMFADGTSILAYNANMRSLVVDKLTGCEMVVFNRLAPGTDIMPLHKLARALNRRVGILYEYTDGTTQPDEIALAYYQLAYVEWKAGKTALGVACYMKSMMTAPIYLAQCTIEMHRLMAETGQGPIDREEVDAILAGEGVPIAPLDSLLDALDDAMRTAIDDNIFQVGQPLLALRLFYRPDDALVNVHKSLNAPLPPQALD